jgi:dephospho-CoA kinase
MFKVGVTGGIGSGKSVVCSVFRNLGVPVYQADKEAKRLMVEDDGIRAGLLDFLGTKAFRGDQLDREYLADRIFSEPEARRHINSLVHPVVRDDFKAWVEVQTGTPYVMEEAALLFETGAWKDLDFNILIHATKETRIARIMKRDGLGRSDVLARMASQRDPEEARRQADLVIVNDEKDLVIPQVLEADKIIRDLALKHS